MVSMLCQIQGQSSFLTLSGNNFGLGPVISSPVKHDSLCTDRLEGSFYIGIAILFLLYGHFRASGKPSISLILTLFSLGTRVALSYALAPSLGYQMIWISVSIGWALADLVGALLMTRTRRLE